jgi:hypothetical protein
MTVKATWTTLAAIVAAARPIALPVSGARGSASAAAWPGSTAVSAASSSCEGVIGGGSR